jgi:nitrite reductase/ring-hydroxylating ferredoxin subunit
MTAQINDAIQEIALDLKVAVEEFHKDGLTRIVRHLRSDPRGKELLMELAAYPSVYTLFAMHGIVRTEASPAEPPKPEGSTGFVPLGNLMLAPGWKMGPPAAELKDGTPFRLDLEDTSVLILMLNGHVSAFKNECAHQGLPLDGGMVDRDACTITCPWHGFRFDAASGECLTAPQAQLVRVEMKTENGRVQVRLP